MTCERIQQNTARRDTSVCKILAYRKAFPSLLFSPCPWVWNKNEDSRQISGIKIKEMREYHRVAHVTFNRLNFVIDLILCILCYIPYILESIPHTFYSFRGLKNQMRIRIACGLDSRSRAGFWKNDRAAVRAARTIQ